MNIDEHKYLWQEEKEDWVLVKSEDNYFIINKRTQMVLLVSDEELDQALIQKMLDSGNKVYNDIEEAYNDI